MKWICYTLRQYDSHKKNFYMLDALKRWYFKV